MRSMRIAVYGAGGFGREAAWLVQSCADHELACFIDDNEVLQGTTINGIPVMGLEDSKERFPDAMVIGGVGSPRVRQRLMERAAAAGFVFARVIHPRVERSQWIEIGEGTVICAGCVLTVNIVLGRHVQINPDCTIGHDVVMNDYASLAPGVHVSGHVHLGRRAYIGTGAVIINGTPDRPLVIGDDAIVGAGACVAKSVPAGLTVAGVPANPLHRP